MLALVGFFYLFNFDSTFFDQLIERVRVRHYSTFVFYSQAELEKAIIGFAKNIKRHFRDTQRVTWVDEYALFTIRKDEMFGPLAHI
ncbi:hypothetical protein ACFLTK_00680 [Chloroflexota bacterium]